MEQQANSPLGAGPFLFESWTRDVSIEYRRNEAYWNPEAPRLDALKMSYFSDNLVGGQAFLSGQGDYLTSIVPSQVDEFRRRADAGEFAIGSYPQGVHVFLLNHLEPPYDNRDVRRAMALAVNRQEMVNQVYLGLAQPMYVVGIAPNHPQFRVPEIAYDRDLEQARSLLAKAGFPNGFEDTLLTFDVPQYQDMAVVFQANMREVGIDLELEVLDLNTFVERALTNKQYRVAALGFALDQEPSARINRYITSSGVSNFVNYSNAEVDDLLARARSTYDVAERRTLYQEALEIAFVEDAVLIPTTTETIIHAYRSTTNGLDYRPEFGAKWHNPIMSTSS